MSMPKIEKSDNPIDREQSVNNLIESVALMETGLSHVINAEGEKIQKVIKADSTQEVLLDDILKVNNSAEKMINTISKLEMILQNKLDISKEIVEMSSSPSPFMSCYAQYLGFAQTVAANSNIVFSSGNKAGDGIEFTAPGDTFTITKSGLYLVDWSINLATNNVNRAGISVIRNGDHLLPITNSATVGNMASGAIINATNPPYTISIGSNTPIILQDYAASFGASIRIIRFADGPST